MCGWCLWRALAHVAADWGRYGESVHQVSKMCAAYIRGLQGNHSKYLKIAATVKHYAFYSGPECDGRTYDGGGCQEFPGVVRSSNPAAACCALR